MKKIAVLLCIVALTGFAMAQTYSDNAVGIQGVDKLGAHQNGGRGCVGCHAPHSGARGNGGNAAAGSVAVSDDTTGNFALWGQDLGPLYNNITLGFGDEGSYTIALPTSSAVTGEDEQLLTGVTMCLSCHDGNIAKGAMMANQSYEQARGLLPAGYGTFPIPTLLGNDGTPAGNYHNDHPIGPLAKLGALGSTGIATRLQLTTCGTTPVACLQPDPAKSDFMAFYNHYGAFNITQSTTAYPRGGRTTGVVIPAAATDATTAYLVCTTCHTPHSMYTFGFTDATNTRKTYPTYFFVAAPYNPGAPVLADAHLASSATQFCRQCHFTGAGGANEGSGIMGVTTAW